MIISVLLAFSACSKVNVENDIENNQKQDKIKIGLIAPLTGQYGAVGQSLAKSAKLALKDYPNIELIVENDNFNPNDGLIAYQKLRDVNEVDGMIIISTPVIEALKPLIEADNMEVIAVGQDLNPKSDLVFHIGDNANPVFLELGKYMRSQEKPVFVLQEDHAWSEITKEYYLKGAGQNAEIIYFKQGDNPTSIIAKLRDKEYKTISVTGTPDGIVPLLKKMDELDYEKEVKNIVGPDVESYLGMGTISEVDVDFF